MNIMMKVFTSIMAMSMCIVLGACNHVSRIGQVGDREYFVVRSTDVSGPNIGLIVQRDTVTGEVSNVNSFGVDGILPSAIRAGGEVAAASVYDGDNVSSTTTVKNQTTIQNRPSGPNQPFQPHNP